jgi:hypothetical protein
MDQETPRHELTRKGVVYQLARADAVIIRQDVQYGVTDSGPLTFDLYCPPETTSDEPMPVVVFVNGYPDPGVQRFLGCKTKEMESYISWGKLTAASGMAAIIYTTGKDPAVDTQLLLHYVRQNAPELRIDESRIGLWAFSGHVPNALTVLMERSAGEVMGAVLCYGCMLDLDGATSMEEAAKQWGFAYPCAGKSLADFPQNVPLFIARAGRDEIPNLNETMDRFIAKALTYNLPITLVNHPTAPHAFDLMQDSETTRQIIRQMLAFMQFNLQV